MERLQGDNREREKIIASIVICPSSLIGYWMHEVSRIMKRAMNTTCIQYTGPPKDRQKVWDNLNVQDNIIVVTRYVGKAAI